MGTVIYILLALFSAGLYYYFWRWKKTELNKYSGIMQALCAGMLFLLYIKLFLFIYAENSKKELFKTEQDYMELAGKYATDYLADYAFYTKNAKFKSKKKKKVLIIDFPRGKNMPGSKMSDSIIEGIRRGSRINNLEIVRVARPKVYSNPHKYWLWAKAFDNLILRNPDLDYVISLVGMPKDVQKITFWRKPNAPKLFLIRADISSLEEVFLHDAIIGAFVFMPGSSFKFAKKLDSQNEENLFYEYFIFISPKNIKEVKKDFSELFAKKKRVKSK